MNILTQEAKKRQAVVLCAIKYDNKSYAGRKYGYSLALLTKVKSMVSGKLSDKENAMLCEIIKTYTKNQQKSF